MKITFETRSWRDAAEDGWPGTEDARFDGWWEDEAYTTGLWRMEDGKPVRFLGRDGGEPEDQRMYRDWWWVEEELNKLAAELQEVK